MTFIGLLSSFKSAQMSKKQSLMPWFELPQVGEGAFFVDEDGHEYSDKNTLIFESPISVFR